jgi:fructokinase
MNTLSIGEILWDIIEDVPHLGGAPFNVSAHLAKMGAKAHIASSVGHDELGVKAWTQAKDLGLQTTYLTKVEYPTGTVPVTLNNGQPSYTITENTAWDHFQLSNAQIDHLKTIAWDCIIFGTLAQRTADNRAVFDQIFDGIQAKELFYDVNLRQDYYSKAIIESSLERASIFKLNDEEVDILAPLLFQKAMNFEDFAQACIQQFHIKAVCITRGANGVFVVTADENYDAPGTKVTVADTVGAGDSFSAAFIYTYLRSGDFAKAAKIGCQLGAYVASQHGAIPEYSEKIKQLLVKV